MKLFRYVEKSRKSEKEKTSREKGGMRERMSEREWRRNRRTQRAVICLVASMSQSRHISVGSVSRMRKQSRGARGALHNDRGYPCCCPLVPGLIHWSGSAPHKEKTIIKPYWEAEFGSVLFLKQEYPLFVYAKVNRVQFHANCVCMCVWFKNNLIFKHCLDIFSFTVKPYCPHKISYCRSVFMHLFLNKHCFRVN